MKTASDLEPWTLSPEDCELIAAKNVANRLDIALLLKGYQSTGRFPTTTVDIAPEAIAHLVRQIKVDAATLGNVQAGRSSAPAPTSARTARSAKRRSRMPII